MSVTREILEKTRFFIDKAAQAEMLDRREYCYYLEAAIIHLRSITFHLQKEFAHIPGFAEWYEKKQKHLKNNAFAKFIVEKRNFLLKEGPIRTQAIHTMSVSGGITLSGVVSCEVVRGHPWYRRPLRTIIEDLISSLIRRCKGLFPPRTAKRHPLINQSLIESSVLSSKTEIFFAEKQWSSTKAVTCLANFLNILESLIAEAESTYESGDSASPNEPAA